MSHVDGIDITARTRLLAILGHPVGHSLSPVMHNAALRDRGIDAVYLAFDVEPDDLALALGGLKTLGFVGANVTVPHKETAARLMDALDPLAARVGAVNTVVNKKGLLIGHNTDVTGFASALESVRARGRRGLIASWRERAALLGLWWRRWWKGGPAEYRSSTGR